MTTKGETHYPTGDHWLWDVPAVEHHDCTEAFHVESGALTTTRPRKAATEEPAEPVESEES